MFPLRDDNPTINKSVATLIIIAINIAVWIFVQGLGAGSMLVRSVCAYGLIPGELLGTVPEGTAIPLGYRMAYIIEGDPNWFSLISHMFMHGGWFHIIGNLWFLSVFGDNVEDAMGRIRFLVFYLLCGLAAAGAQILSNPGSTVPMVGASGAIGGVMGAYAVLYPNAGVHVLIFFGIITRIILPAWLMLGYWFLLQLVGAIPSVAGSGGGVAFWAHIGGFAAGVVLLQLFQDKNRVAAHRSLMRRMRWR
ncbi:MAG: rhomboid family intramembrane serine protease [Chitinispirillaceae bacterium]|nr:rhomboid family intramembrane serine protease [Chitinispirillaceae bacterium]